MSNRDLTRTGLKVAAKTGAGSNPREPPLRRRTTVSGPPVNRVPSRGRLPPAKKPEAPPRKAGEPSGPAPPPKKKPEPMRPSDALNTEFIYYNSALKLLLPTLSNQSDRDLIAPWLAKLNSPLYNSPSLRDKRNRFLHSLLICVLNDEAFGWFRQPPPHRALPDAEAMPVYSPPACAWQTDTTWPDVLAAVPERLQRKSCACDGVCGAVHDRVTEQLDEEFQFLLYLIRPFVDLYTDLEDRDKISRWIQMLCCITKESCVMMKGNRNDYMAALLGYAQNLQLSGPFRIPPDFDKKLPALNEATQELEDKPSFMDPSGTEAEDFLKGLPIPEEGAFCYIALTGDITS